MERSTEGKLMTEIIIETFKLGGILVTEGDRISAPLGLTSARWKILGALAHSETPLTVSHIARNMGQTRQAVQTLVNILSDSGLIEWHDNPNHKRARLAQLTAEGENVYQQMDDIQIPWVNQLSGNVKMKDLEITLETLKKISVGLTE